MFRPFLVPLCTLVAGTKALGIYQVTYIDIANSVGLSVPDLLVWALPDKLER